MREHSGGPFRKEAEIARNLFCQQERLEICFNIPKIKFGGNRRLGAVGGRWRAGAGCAGFISDQIYLIRKDCLFVYFVDADFGYIQIK